MKQKTPILQHSLFALLCIGLSFAVATCASDGGDKAKEEKCSDDHIHFTAGQKFVDIFTRSSGSLHGSSSSASCSSSSSIVDENTCDFNTTIITHGPQNTIALLQQLKLVQINGTQSLQITLINPFAEKSTLPPFSLAEKLLFFLPFLHRYAVQSYYNQEQRNRNPLLNALKAIASKTHLNIVFYTTPEYNLEAYTALRQATPENPFAHIRMQYNGKLQAYDDSNTLRTLSCFDIQAYISKARSNKQSCLHLQTEEDPSVQFDVSFSFTHDELQRRITDMYRTQLLNLYPDAPQIRKIVGICGAASMIWAAYAAYKNPAKLKNVLSHLSFLGSYTAGPAMIQKTAYIATPPY
jgi:hypothetical protein